MNGFWKTWCVCGGIVLMTIVDSAAADADQAEKVVASMGEYRAARQQYEQLMSNLIAERQMALKAGRASAEYQQAVRQVEIAHQQYRVAEAGVIADLRQSNERYRRLLLEHEAVTSEIAGARANSKTTVETYARLHERKASLAADIRAMDGETAGAANVVLFKSKWIGAFEAVEALDVRLRAQVEDAPAVVAAREKAEAAQNRMDDAGVRLITAQAAYRQASYEQAQEAYFRARQAEYLESRQYRDDAAAAALFGYAPPPPLWWTARPLGTPAPSWSSR